MKDKKYQYLLYLISGVIAITLAIQVYWNYKNYQEREQQLSIDLQTALDQSVEDYFTIRAKNNTISFVNSGNPDFNFEDVFDKVDLENLDDDDNLRFPDSLQLEGVTILRGINADTLKTDAPTKLPNTTVSRFFKKPADSIDNGFEIKNIEFKDEDVFGKVKELTSRVVFSISSTKINPEKVDSLFKSQLIAKDISINHSLVYETPDSTYHTQLNSFPAETLEARSELIDKDSNLKLLYHGLGTTILKRNLTGILLSTLLIAAVIFCLFYLLAIIKKQKALSIMKNDLISNITHEFKTPIATASAALEGVQSFTASGDLEKTNRYLSMSREQLHKLHGMVEKLLDTATLDSQELVLQKSDIELESLIADSVSKFQEQTSKQINYEVFKDTIIHADVFHLENAISNLIDNAIKYGGNEITINAYTDETNTIITIKDSGTDLKKSQEKLLFDQFYRVPKGNQHDVKGFGIGLYYTKSIIDKHNGSIELITKPSTTFKISIPNE